MIYNSQTVHYMGFLPSYAGFMNSLYDFKFERDSTGFPMNFTKNSDLTYLFKNLEPALAEGKGSPRLAGLTEFAVKGF